MVTPFNFKSIECGCKVTIFFQEMLEIYGRAKDCYYYASQLEPSFTNDKLHATNKFPALQKFKYATSRISIIDLSNLYKENSYYRFTKLLNILADKTNGVFPDNGEQLSFLRTKVLQTINQHEKLLDMRDMQFAHHDSFERIYPKQFNAVRYTDVKVFFDDTLDLLKLFSNILQYNGHLHNPIWEGELAAMLYKLAN